jgi:hypothetical protein
VPVDDFSIPIQAQRERYFRSQTKLKNYKSRTKKNRNFLTNIKKTSQKKKSHKVKKGNSHQKKQHLIPSVSEKKHTFAQVCACRRENDASF